MLTELVPYFLNKLCFSYLRYSLSLGDILISDLHSWVAKSLEHISRVQRQ